MKILFILVLIFNMNFILSSCTKHQESIKEDQTVESYWTCSMHPQIHKEGPDKCPICGMDLVLVKTQGVIKKSTLNHPSGHGTIFLDNEKQEMIGIKTGIVVKKELFKSIDAAGRVAFDPELFVAQNEYIEAIRQEESVRNSPVADVRHSSRSMIESAQTRLKILGLSDLQISELRDSSKNTSSYLIPKSGDRLWIYAEVYEVDLPYIHPELNAKISGRTLEGKIIEGKVISVDRVINPVTRTAKVRIALNNPPMELRPESYVDVRIESSLGEQTVVPFDSIMDTGKEAWVFVISNEGKIDPRKIIIKSYAGDEVAISMGITVGEKIVTSANFLVDSESRLVGTREEMAKSAPSCPEGKTWSDSMKHCM